MALRQIAASLPESDTVALRALYQQLKCDECPSLSVSELDSAMLNKGQNIKKLEILQLVRDISVDGREEISFLDFMAANMRVRHPNKAKIFTVVCSWVNWHHKRTLSMHSGKLISMETTS